MQLSYDVLFTTLHTLHRQPLRQALIQNVGHMTSHHAGLFPLARRSLGILRPTTDKCGALQLGQGGRLFRTESLSDIMMLRISTIVSFGQAMLETRDTKTTHAWVKEVARLQHATMGPPRVCGLMGPQSYRTLWVIRSLFLWCMRHCQGFIHLLS